jgi:hypothetical protein
LIRAQRKDRKPGILDRQKMQETLCYLLSIDYRLPKLDVAGIVRLAAAIKDSGTFSFATLDDLGPT